MLHPFASAIARLLSSATVATSMIAFRPACPLIPISRRRLVVELATKTVQPTFIGYTFTFQSRPSASTAKSASCSLLPWNAVTDGILPWNCQLDNEDTAAELGPDDQVDWLWHSWVRKWGSGWVLPESAFRVWPESDKVSLACHSFPSWMKVVFFWKVVWAFRDMPLVVTLLSSSSAAKHLRIM